jgi:hypothetical protein
MKKLNKLIAALAVLALVAAACGDDDDATPTQPPATDPPPVATDAPPPPATDAPPPPVTDAPDDPIPMDPLSEWGETTAADPGLIARALGPVEPTDEASWNIILASIARATQDVDQATIDIVIDCMNNQECDTGTGGGVIMGWADGGGDDVNTWRAVSHMEAILQALTYPQIGTIVSVEANFSFDPDGNSNDIRFLIQRGVDFIVGYPDLGLIIGDAIKEATAAGIPYIPYSAGWVGLPGQEGALVPGTDYLTVVGEDLCALGESFAGVLNDGVGTGKVAVLGGSPGNALSLGWQRCAIPALGGGVDLVNPPANADSTTGDTNWFPPIIPDVFRGLLSQDEDIAGFAYEYADGIWFGLPVFGELGIPFEGLTIALRTDEQRLFCDAAETNDIFYSAGGNFQARVAVTAAMMSIAGAEIPAEIVVPHVMRKATAADCDPDRAAVDVSGTSLVPAEVLSQYFGLRDS